MADTGYLEAEVVENIDNGGHTWANPLNARYEDASNAAIYMGKNNFTDILRSTDYRFGAVIPPGSAITGFQVGNKRACGAVDSVHDLNLKITVWGNQYGDEKASAVQWNGLPVAFTYYGGVTDDWTFGGVSRDVRDVTFGNDLAVDNDLAQLRWIYVNVKQMKVHYTPSKINGTPSWGKRNGVLMLDIKTTMGKG